MASLSTFDTALPGRRVPRRCAGLGILLPLAAVGAAVTGGVGCSCGEVPPGPGDDGGAGTLPELAVNDVTAAEGNAGTSIATFTVALSAPSDQAVSFAFATADGTATTGSDYVATSGTLTLSPGVTSQLVTVVVNGDTAAEPDETFYLNLSGPVNATVAKAQGSATIVDDDGLPALSINDLSNSEGNGGTTAFSFTVSLSRAGAQPISVQYATADGTAASASDYVPASGTLSFAPGVTSQTVTVSVNGDTSNEPDETFFVNLSNAVNASIADGQGVATIANDDGPGGTPALSINDVTQNEGNGGTTAFSFTVTLSRAGGQAASVQYTTADNTAAAGSDYTAASGTLNFTAGTTTQTVTISVNGDTATEADEVFFVNLSSPVNATIADGQGIGTIVNDDGPPSISINDVDKNEGDAGATTFSFTVAISRASTQAVSVQYATADGTAAAGSDYVAASGTLNFAAGTTTQVLTISVNGDAVTEPDETFSVNLSNAANATIADGQGAGTIVNDDGPPTVSIGDVTRNEGNSGSTPFIFTVALSRASAQAVTVHYATADGTASAGSDYVAASGTLSFAAGVTSQLVTVSVSGDTAVEPSETFFVNLSNPVNATIADGQGLATVLNDDGAPALTISDVRENEGNAATTAFTFTVSISIASTQTVSVEYATGGGTADAPQDYAATSGTITFSPGTTTRTVSVSVVGDLLNEPDETFLVNLSNPVNATIADGQGRGTIMNDDALPALSINDVSSFEGNSGAKQFAFTVALSPASGRQVTVQYGTANGTATAGMGAGADYQSASGTVTFAAGETSRDVSVSVHGDMTVETNETFFVNLSNPVNATVADSQGLGTILNDD